MDLALLVYAISLIGNVKGILVITSVLLVLVAAIYGVLFICEYEKIAWEKAKKDNWPTLSKSISAKMKKYIFAASVVICVTALVPSEKIAYTMVAAYAAQSIVQDPKVEQLSSKVLKIVENKLDSYIKEPTKVP